MSDVTRILKAVEQGDPGAAEELLPLVYEELRRLAAHKMSNEAHGQVLLDPLPGLARPRDWISAALTLGGARHVNRVRQPALLRL